MKKPKREPWLVRWERLQIRMWDRFHRMPVSEESLGWMERKSAWLCRLVPPTTTSQVTNILKRKWSGL